MSPRALVAAALFWMSCAVVARASVPAPLPPPVATFDVGSLHVQQWGSGPKSLVFIPGLTCGPWEWSGQIALFSHDYTVYALTLPGFDGRPAISGPLFSTTTSDFWKFLADRHIVKPVVIGHSLGGTMGFMLATQHPELLGGVVSLDGLPIFPSSLFMTPEQIKAQAAQLLAQIGSSTPQQFQSVERQQLSYMLTAPSDVDAVLPLVARSDPGATLRWLAEDLELDLRPHLSKATVPILLLAPFDESVDSHVHIPTIDAKRTFYAGIVKNAPNVHVLMIDRSRHFAMYDEPQAVDDDISQFLATLNAPSVSLAQSPAATPHPLPANCTAVQQPFIGTICTPPSSGKHPAILLLGGSEGGDHLSAIAPLFAAHGYVAVSVAYFGEPGLPQTLVDVPVETIGRALDVVRARVDVDDEEIGIFGGSKGGELALLAASTYPQIKAVVADVPSPFAWQGIDAYGQPQKCSWTLGGRELPCIPESASSAASRRIGAEYAAHQPMQLRMLYDASLQAATPAQILAAFFPIERIHGPVLCLSGGDDELWDSPEYCNMAMEYLHARHHPYADRAIEYANAGHTFLWAMHGPQSAALTAPVPGGASIALGGTADGNAQASAQAWRVIWQFFSKELE